MCSSARASQVRLSEKGPTVGSRRAFIDTTHIELERWRPSLVDADWHGFCQAMYKGIEGKAWEALYSHY